MREILSIQEIKNIRSKGLDELKDSLMELEHGASLLPKIFFEERKKIILDRIQELSSYERIKSIQDLIRQVPDDNLKRNLSVELSALREGSEKYQKEINDITTREIEEKIKLEQFERKSKIWLSFLQRESAASIIGGIVLLMVTVALIFGAESQILSNGFLVILGYFFGQSSVKNNKDGSSDSM